jgi:hypothetical protein
MIGGLRRRNQVRGSSGMFRRWARAFIAKLKRPLSSGSFCMKALRTISAGFPPRRYFGGCKPGDRSQSFI